LDTVYGRCVDGAGLANLDTSTRAAHRHELTEFGRQLPVSVKVLSLSVAVLLMLPSFAWSQDESDLLRGLPSCSTRKATATMARSSG
jgi:hypothetical protein